MPRLKGRNESMTEIFRKLNFRDQNPILIVGAPSSFAGEIAAMRPFATIHEKAHNSIHYGFVLAFAAMKTDLVAAAELTMPVSLPEAILWFAYPKKTSPHFTSDLSREACWEALVAFDLQPNRQIAIDDDWSALRFKKV
jgi:hypothetical protein